MSGQIIRLPTAAQLNARNHPERKKFEKDLEGRVRCGLVYDTGERKWCEETGRDEIVWDLTPKGLATVNECDEPVDEPA